MQVYFLLFQPMSVILELGEKHKLVVEGTREEHSEIKNDENVLFTDSHEVKSTNEMILDTLATQFLSNNAVEKNEVITF